MSEDGEKNCAAQRPHDGAHDGNREHREARALDAPITSARLHQTCRPVDQCMYVCVEKCPLTRARAAGAAAGEQERSCRALLRSRNDSALAGCAPEAEAELVRHGRVRAQAGHQSKRTTWMRNRGTRAPTSHLHAQRAEEENSGAGQSSRPRAARKGACAGRHGRTVRNQAVHGTSDFVTQGVMGK